MKKHAAFTLIELLGRAFDLRLADQFAFAFDRQQHHLVTQRI